jgi:hypothetical protein
MTINIYLMGVIYLMNKIREITCTTVSTFPLQAIQQTSCFVAQVIPFEEWQDEYFPTNCWGVVYIMSSEVRDNLIKVSYVTVYSGLLVQGQFKQGQ